MSICIFVTNIYLSVSACARLAAHCPMNYPMALEFASDAIKKDIHFGCFAVQADFRNLQCLDPIVQEYAWAPAISRMNRENLPAFTELCRRKQDSACTSLLFVNDSFFKKRGNIVT